MAEPTRNTNLPDDSSQASNDARYNSPGARRDNSNTVGGGKSAGSPLPPPKKKESLPEKEARKDTSVAKSDDRITQSDRSYLNKPFFEDSKTSRVGQVTMDEKFSQSYAQSGLQPSYASQDPRIKNVRVREKYAEQNARREAANDASYQTTQGAVVQPRSNIEYRQTQTATKKQKTKVKISRSQTKKARRKARALNRAMTGPLLFGYMFFQLPFAILNLVFFGFSYLYLEISDTIEDLSDGFFGFVFKAASFIASSVSDALSKLSGGTINLGEIFDAVDPTNYFMATTILIFAFGLIQLMIIGLIYNRFGIDSLGGKGSGMKMMAVILCLTGYFMPILNFFPWIFTWTLTITRYPK